jgi:hypothetical protein
MKAKRALMHNKLNSGVVRFLLLSNFISLSFCEVSGGAGE